MFTPTVSLSRRSQRYVDLFVLRACGGRLLCSQFSEGPLRLIYKTFHGTVGEGYQKLADLDLYAI